MGARIDALPELRILRPVSQFVRNSEAQTVFVKWIPGVAVANGAALTVTVEGTSVSGVTAPEGLAAGDSQGLILPIAIATSNSGTIARSSDAIAGHVEIQLTHGGVTDTTFMAAVDAAPVAGPTYTPIVTDMAVTGSSVRLAGQISRGIVADWGNHAGILIEAEQNTTRSIEYTHATLLTKRALPASGNFRYGLSWDHIPSGAPNRVYLWFQNLQDTSPNFLQVQVAVDDAFGEGDTISISWVDY